jgi:hypothetical protein
MCVHGDPAVSTRKASVATVPFIRAKRPPAAPFLQPLAPRAIHCCSRAVLHGSLRPLKDLSDQHAPISEIKTSLRGALPTDRNR